MAISGVGVRELPEAHTFDFITGEGESQNKEKHCGRVLFDSKFGIGSKTGRSIPQWIEENGRAATGERT